jgi:hypothetical protein
MPKSNEYSKEQLIALIERLKNLLNDVRSLNQNNKPDIAIGLIQGAVAFLDQAGF